MTLNRLLAPWGQQPHDGFNVRPHCRATCVVVGALPFQTLISNEATDMGTSYGPYPSDDYPTGRALVTTNSKQALKIAASARTLFGPLGNSGTIAIVRQSRVTTPAQTCLFGGTNGNLRISAHVPWDNNYVYFDFGNADTLRVVSYDAAYKSLLPQVWVFTAEPGHLSIWLDGDPIGYRSNNVAESPLATYDFPIGILGSIGNSPSDDEQIFLAVFSDTRWQDDEIRAFTRNPYGYTFDAQEIWVPTPDVLSVPVLSLPEAYNVRPTTAKLRVTATF